MEMEMEMDMTVVGPVIVMRTDGDTKGFTHRLQWADIDLAP